MMRRLVGASLRYRVVVLLGAALLVFAGLRVARDAPLDVFPEFAPPLVEVQTEAPGLSSVEVEALVTVPIENALAGIPRLRTLRSKSVLGLSAVVLIFGDGTDLMVARQLVQERIGLAAARLPLQAKAPVLLQPLSATSRVLKIGLVSATKSQMEMTDLVRWTLRPRLMAIPGVANVAIWGQRDRQLQVRVDPERLRAHSLRLDDVTRATREAVTPSAGGFVDTPNQRLAITHSATVHSAAELATMPIATRGAGVLRLGDVADVREDFPAPIGDAVVNDQPGLLLIVEKQPSANTLEVTRQVEAALAMFRPAMPGVEIVSGIFRPASFIERALTNLAHALLIGCALVILILLLFLHDWRTALISVLAIPLSLVAAAAVLSLTGATLNTMALAGLAIALGEVVDDAIIDVENILRRLRLERSSPTPRPAFEVVLDASLEVRSAVVYATVIVLAAFLPVYFLDGVAGAFFRPLALAYTLAVFASMLVALVVTPAFALLLLPRTIAAEPREAPLAKWLRERFTPRLAYLVDRPQFAVAALVSLFALTAAIVPLLGESFMPIFRENDFLMHWVAKPGASLDAVRRTVERASRELRTVAGVRAFGSHLGRAEVADEVVGPNFSELWISLSPDVDYEPTVAKIQHIVDGYPGLTRDLQTYLQERIKEVLTGASGAIVVRLYGPDLEVLREHANRIGHALAPIEGVANLKVEPQVLVPSLDVRVRTDAAQRMGILPGEVRRAASTLVQGSKVGEVYIGDRVIDVVVWGAAELRDDPRAIANLRIDTPTGLAPLADLADVSVQPTPNVVQRERASRRIDVSCDAKGRDLGAVVRDIEATLAKGTLPAGHHWELVGEYAARAAARTRLGSMALASVLLVLLILYADFRALRLVVLLALTLPFALVGGVFAAAMTGGVLSLGSLVGLVTVLGIAARNGILLVSHYRQLEDDEGIPFGRDLVLRGTAERLTPVLMTALATGLALLPLALGGNRPGQEIEHPMAIVILGGLLTSTALNLFLLPALYLRFAKRST